MVVRCFLPRSAPALLRHQPFHGAPGHVVALCAQVQPHLAGTEPDPELVVPGRSDQREDLGITQSPLRGPP